MPLVGTGPPRTEPKVGVGWSGRESDMAVDRFCRNVVVPPVWECEAMGFMLWVQCATSAECMLNLSIVASSVMGTVHSRSHYRVLVEMEDKPKIIKLVNKDVITRIW